MGCLAVSVVMFKSDEKLNFMGARTMCIKVVGVS